MIHTIYNNLSNDEFLRIVESRVGRSPIIDELYKRLSCDDYELDDGSDVDCVNEETLYVCPVCEAYIQLDVGQ